MKDKIQWTGDNFADIQNFCGEHAKFSVTEGLIVFNDPRWFRVYPGDYVVRDGDYFLVERGMVSA